MAWLPTDHDATTPLAGVRVLDFSELLPGPFLTQSLVELGADVLKVERPPHGDNVRHASPGVFAAVNRGKRSLLLNLKDPDDRARALTLADEADVVVESFRPGVMDRLGVGWPALSARNPRLVMVSISGYGASGPRHLWPGHDINYLAAAGVVSIAVTDREPSPSFALQIADLGAATYGLAALNAALFQRERTGRGQHLEVSLTDCAAHWMNTRVAMFRARDALDARSQRHLVQHRAAYGVFRCRDGGLLSIAALEEHFWVALARALELRPYADDEYRDHARRAAEATSINDAIATALGRIDRDDALRRLIAADVPAAEVVDALDVPASPYFAGRGLFVDSAIGPLCRFPVRLSSMPEPPAASPELDAH